MLKIAIVEDDDICKKRLKEYLGVFFNERSINYSLDFFNNGLDFITGYTPKFDLIFMDMIMPHMDGMEASIELRKLDKEVELIFITNMMQYAIKGYEVNANDFILKPVNKYDFEMKMNRVVDSIRKKRTLSITINTNSKLKKINIYSILFVEVYNHILIYHCTDGDYECSGQLKNLESSSKFSDFIRTSNSYLVNMIHINEVHNTSLIVGNSIVPISRRKKKYIMERLNNYFGEIL